MLKGNCYLMLVLVLCTCFGQLKAQSESWCDSETTTSSEFKTLWNSADALHTAKRYNEAEFAYIGLQAKYPKSQRVALRIGVTREASGKIAEAIRAYEKSIAMDPTSDWAATALFYKARCCSTAGDHTGLDDSLNRLQAFHPDSPYVTRGTLIRVKSNGGYTLQAEVALNRELQAGKLYDDAMVMSGHNQDSVALEQFAVIVRDYPEARVRLRALEAMGHILVRNKRYAEAADAFTSITLTLPLEAQSSRIALVAKSRLAALQHSAGDRDGALGLYLSVAESTIPAKALIDNAMLQSSGLVFEQLQRKVWKRQPPDKKQWVDLIAALNSISSDTNQSTDTRTVAGLMKLEALGWSGDHHASLIYGRQFLGEFGNSTNYKKEVATACQMLCHSAKENKDYGLAIEYGRRVVDLYPVAPEVWSGMDHVSRTYFDLYESLRFANRTAEAAQALSDFRRRFPDSDYLKAIEYNEKARFYDSFQPGGYNAK